MQNFWYLRRTQGVEIREILFQLSHFTMKWFQAALKYGKERVSLAIEESILWMKCEIQLFIERYGFSAARKSIRKDRVQSTRERMDRYRHDPLCHNFRIREERDFITLQWRLDIISISNAGSSLPRRWKQVGFLRHASILSMSLEDGDKIIHPLSKKKANSGERQHQSLTFWYSDPADLADFGEKIFAAFQELTHRRHPLFSWMSGWERIYVFILPWVG